MFDRLYELYVNSRIIRVIYQAGFFIYWADWAERGLNGNPPDVTWLVFGWLPAVFWPIQLIATMRLPYLPYLWMRTYPVAGVNVPWGILLIFGLLIAFSWSDLKFAWSEIKAWLKRKNPGDKAKPSPAE